jgi:hypothetical protein
MEDCHDQQSINITLNYKTFFGQNPFVGQNPLDIQQPVSYTPRHCNQYQWYQENRFSLIGHDE